MVVTLCPLAVAEVHEDPSPVRRLRQPINGANLKVALVEVGHLDLVAEIRMQPVLRPQLLAAVSLAWAIRTVVLSRGTKRNPMRVRVAALAL